MEQKELKEQATGSKEQRSRGMRMDDEEEKELNMKGIDTQLSSVGAKNEQRKVTEQEIEYLMSEFLLPRNKAVNILRKLDLKQAVKSLVHA